MAAGWLALAAFGCAAEPEIVRPEDLRATVPGATSLVVVYSRTGHTATMARALARVLGADYLRVQGTGKEGGSWFSTPSWQDTVEVTPARIDLAPYRLVLFGGPIWYWRPDALINSALRSSDLNGKRVVLFFTFEGGAMSEAAQATWKGWATERGAARVEVVGIDRKQFPGGEALVREAERIARSHQVEWLR